MANVGVVKWGLHAGNWVAWSFKFGFAFIFVFYLFTIALLSSIEQKDAGVFVKEIGIQLTQPLETLADFVSSIETPRGGVIQNTFTYIGLLFHFYKIWLWVYVFLIIVNLFTKDSLPLFIRLLFAFSLFLIIEMFYFVVYREESLNYLFSLIKTIYSGLFSFVK